MRRAALLLHLSLVVLGLALVSQPRSGAAADTDPVVEERVQRIAAELRCLVCQNQTIADSNAGLAEDLRREVRRMVKEGRSDQEVRAFMVERYGDFVLYRPPLKSATVLLWSGPFLLLIIGAWALRRTVANRRALELQNEVSPEEQARLRELLRAEQGTQPR